MDDRRDVREDLEELRTPVPGARTRDLAPALRARESRNVTFFSDRFPVFWESAEGATVTDVDGNRYVDLTAAFGVANVGHANPSVVSAIADQAARLTHGMGDVHPTEVKSRLLERLGALLPAQLDKTFLATTGSEAVEAAMKTAMLATGKPFFASYRNAYHGLSLGALAVSGIEKFRAPFASAIGGGENLLLTYPGTYGDDADATAAIERTRRELGERDDLAALLIEPIQGRGGTVVPPDGYLSALRDLCTERGILLVFDEIYTGFGRTGTWFAMEREGVVPDVLCIGKAMGGGFPISATVARSAVMDAWPLSRGEALHTSTYLGNPMGCAAALATIDELARRDLPARAERLGGIAGARLEAMRRAHRAVRAVRGRGLMWGIDLSDAAAAERVVVEALARGVVALQAGPGGNVVSITPPLVIGERQLERALEILDAILAG